MWFISIIVDNQILNTRLIDKAEGRLIERFFLPDDQTNPEPFDAHFAELFENEFPPFVLLGSVFPILSLVRLSC